MKQSSFTQEPAVLMYLNKVLTDESAKLKELLAEPMLDNAIEESQFKNV